MVTKAEQSQDLHLASRRARVADAGSSSPEAEEQLQDGQAETSVTLLFSSGLQWTWEAHPRWERQPAVLSLLTQMSLTSSRNTLPDTPRVMFDRMSGHPVAQSSSLVNYPHHRAQIVRGFTSSFAGRIPFASRFNAITFGHQVEMPFCFQSSVPN